VSGRFFKSGRDFVVVILGVVKSFKPPICQFILRTDESGFRDILTPNDWQKRQWEVVSRVKREGCSRSETTRPNAIGN
jgi:hypothetical protein